jgi:3-oxoadipate enol-lactonase
MSRKIEHKTLLMNGYDIHFYVSGQTNTETIFFLHPAFSDHKVFNSQVDYFSKDFKVITIDFIGHGMSKAARSKDKIDASSLHLLKIMDLEEVNKAHLVGVSMGSLIAQFFALEYPDKTRSLITLGGYNINKPNKDIEKTQRSSNISLIISAIFSMDLFRRRVAKITCYTQRGQDLFYESARLFERKSFMVMSALQNIIKYRNIIDSPYPLLILTGEHDITLAIKMAKEWHSEIGNTTLHMISNAGHCANLDNPVEFNKVVKEFIDTNRGK